MTLVEPRWDDARAALADAVRPLAPVRHVLAACDGLVLAEDLVALCALPSFDTSAMDGWAVAGPGPWTIVGQSLAGRPVPGPLTPGQAVVIATGGVVPRGGGCGGPQRGRSGPGAWWGRGAQRTRRPDGPTHVRPAGEECAEGEVLAPAGTVLNPALIGLAAAAGHDELLVVPGPRVALVLFGDELATAGVPAPGTGARLARPAGARLGGPHGRRRRARGALRGHARRACRGDPSCGRGRRRGADHRWHGGRTGRPPARGDRACARARCVIDSVAVRPGHPMLAATLDRGRAWLVGLPGQPAERDRDPDEPGRADPGRAWPGGPTLPELAEVTCAEAVGAPAHEDRLVLGRLVDGEFVPGSHLGSGMLRGLAAATGFAVAAPGWGGCRGVRPLAAAAA